MTAMVARSPAVSLMLILYADPVAKANDAAEVGTAPEAEHEVWLCLLF